MAFYRRLGELLLAAGTITQEELEKRAEIFALSRAGRSPRAAKQFVEYLKGMEE